MLSKPLISNSKNCFVLSLQTEACDILLRLLSNIIKVSQWFWEVKLLYGLLCMPISVRDFLSWTWCKQIRFWKIILWITVLPINVILNANASIPHYIQDPNNIKYRQVKLTNPKIESKLLPAAGTFLPQTIFFSDPDSFEIKILEIVYRPLQI